MNLGQAFLLAFLHGRKRPKASQREREERYEKIRLRNARQSGFGPRECDRRVQQREKQK